MKGWAYRFTCLCLNVHLLLCWLEYSTELVRKASV